MDCIRAACTKSAGSWASSGTLPKAAIWVQEDPVPGSTEQAEKLLHQMSKQTSQSVRSSFFSKFSQLPASKRQHLQITSLQLVAGQFITYKANFLTFCTYEAIGQSRRTCSSAAYHFDSHGSCDVHWKTRPPQRDFSSSRVKSRLHPVQLQFLKLQNSFQLISDLSLQKKRSWYWENSVEIQEPGQTWCSHQSWSSPADAPLAWYHIFW